MFARVYKPFTKKNQYSSTGINMKSAEIVAPAANIISLPPDRQQQQNKRPNELIVPDAPIKKKKYQK